MAKPLNRTDPPVDRSVPVPGAASLQSRRFVAVLALLAIVLGYWGLWDFVHGRASQFGTGVWDVAYYDLQLLVLGSEPLQLGGPFPLPLQFARFLAPAVPAYLVFLTARALLAEQLQQLRIWQSAGHTVLFGDPWVTSTLATQITTRLVVIDAPGTVPPVLPRSVWRVAGDPLSYHVLRRAGVDRAAEMLLVSRDTALNAEIAVTVSGLLTPHGPAADPAPKGWRRWVSWAARPWPWRRPERPPTLKCRVEMDDRALWLASYAHQLGEENLTAARFRFELFNPNTRAARGMLERSGLPAAAPGPTLVIADGELGAAVVVELMRRAARARQSWFSPDRPPVIVRLPSRVEADVLTRYPPSGELVRCELVDPAGWPDPDMFYVPGELRPLRAEQVYICLDDEGAGMSLGLTALSALRTKDGLGGRSSRITVAVSRNARFGTPLDVEQLATYNVTTEVYNMESLQIDPEERVARAVHAAYVATCEQRGETVATKPNMAPWEDLSAEHQADNFRQVIDIGHKLTLIGCATTPITSDAPPFILQPHELDLLAELEHERWMAARIKGGWRQGPRDEARKLHPDLVAWDDLGEPSKNLDRSAVRQIPDLLADVGLQIVRLR